MRLDSRRAAGTDSGGSCVARAMGPPPARLNGSSVDAARGNARSVWRMKHGGCQHTSRARGVTCTAPGAHSCGSVIAHCERVSLCVGADAARSVARVSVRLRSPPPRNRAPLCCAHRPRRDASAVAGRLVRPVFEYLDMRAEHEPSAYF